jgi:hypothetical protein
MLIDEERRPFGAENADGAATAVHAEATTPRRLARLRERLSEGSVPKRRLCPSAKALSLSEGSVPQRRLCPSAKALSSASAVRPMPLHHDQGGPPKSTSLVSTVPAVRPGAV